MRLALHGIWPRLLGMVAGLLLIGLPAHADEDEVSIHIQSCYGMAMVGDELAGDLAARVDFMGVGIRASYATSNWYAYEARLSYALSRAAYYDIDDGTTLFRTPEWVRFDAGISARLGALLVPTVQATIGVQQRSAGSGRWIEYGPGYESGEGWVSPARQDRRVEIVGTLGVGLDYRITGHWLAGVGITVQQSLPIGPRYQAVSGLFHLAYYWYWFPWSER